MGPETKKACSKVTEPIILSDYFIIDNIDDKVFLINSTNRHLEVLPVKFKFDGIYRNIHDVIHGENLRSLNHEHSP